MIRQPVIDIARWQRVCGRIFIRFYLLQHYEITKRSAVGSLYKIADFRHEALETETLKS